MKESVIKLLRSIGFNRAISYGVLAMVWRLVSGPVSMIIVTANFSREQQGFYFTISSLLALQIFFELGLMVVLAQFASHEFAHLNWKDRGLVEGNPIHLGRFNDLVCKSTRWFGVASLLLVVGLIPTGLFFFGQEHAAAVDFPWRLPWILAVIGTALNLMVVPFFALIMGSGDVVSVNHRELVGGVLGVCLSWLVMISHGGLFAVFATLCGNILVSWVYLVKRKPELLKIAYFGIFRPRAVVSDGARVSWWDEVWPMQWKIALSWVSGYFIFQLFNPVLFYYHGPVVAGQMGMTLSASNALMGMGMTWLNSRSPEFGKLIATREWHKLDQLFYGVLSQAFFVVVTGAVAGWGVIRLLQEYSKVGNRFLPTDQVAFLLAAVCVQLVGSGLAVYLRAHKQEPFLLLSIFNAIVQGAATWWLGMLFSSKGITLSVLFISLLTTVIGYVIWQRCRENWHKYGDTRSS